jgi:serine/threonine protein kinase, bacterial
VISTPGFMPVEQMAGRPMYASDIHSLGLTAIYLLTGKMPAEMETDPATWGKDEIRAKVITSVKFCKVGLN